MLPEFTCTYMEPKGKPFAKYIFYYRSMGEYIVSLGILERNRTDDLPEALKSLAIVPRTPSPEPPPPLEERDITTLNPEELKELQQRFLAMRVRSYVFYISELPLINNRSRTSILRSSASVLKGSRVRKHARDLGNLQEPYSLRSTKRAAFVRWLLFL